MKLTYVGEAGRVYPDLPVSPEPGQSYDLNADPQDGRWAPEGTDEAQPPQVPVSVAPETPQPPPMPPTETETEATTP